MDREEFYIFYGMSAVVIFLGSFLGFLVALIGYFQGIFTELQLYCLPLIIIFLGNFFVLIRAFLGFLMEYKIQVIKKDKEAL